MSMISRAAPLAKHRRLRGPVEPETPQGKALRHVRWLLERLGNYPPLAVDAIVADLEASGSVESCEALHRIDRDHVAALLAGGYPPVA